MSIIAVLITSILEQYKFLIGIREFFHVRLLQYVRFFISRDFHNQREIRYAYFVACAPIILLLVLLYVALARYVLVFFIIKLIIFIICVQILTWKEEAKITQLHHKSFSFIHKYATKFFAPLFWFLVLPVGAGAICYLIVMSMSSELKNKGLDLVVYNVIVDKMLFYINIIPYVILYIFIAVAGDFENISHYLIEQRKNFTKSFYFLDDILHDVILIAVDKDKFQSSLDYIDNAEAGSVQLDRFNPQMTTYVIALLYRAGLFFIGLIALTAVAHIVGIIS
jgi:hypothetical protein